MPPPDPSPSKYRKFIGCRLLSLILALMCPVTAGALPDLEQHLVHLKKRLPGPEFVITVEEPFVVVGDLPLPQLQGHARQTVGWAVAHLKRMYFERDPKQIVDIWLLRDADSYAHYVPILTGSDPVTPYGFYIPKLQGLYMNIQTGGGTLVHELVHPFIESNFPQCPPWFNEGLASLYEQCGERQGKMVGYTNWRLEGLQQAIHQGTLGGFPELMKMNSADFYGPGSARHYAQARYLCLYLQEQGQLQEFYHRLSRQPDPSGGAETLRQLLQIQDWQAFQKQWQSWVLKLQFPPRHS